MSFEEGGYCYGCDICSLYNMIIKEKQDKNPYNRNKMPVNKIYEDIVDKKKNNILKEKDMWGR